MITNGIRQARKGVDISERRILVLVSSSWTQCFRIRPCLHQSFPCSRQSINWYHSAWCTTYQNYFPFSSLLARGRGKKGRKKPSFSALLFSFFPSRVYCHVIPYRVLFSNKKLERVI